jgi:hypothetical protein
VLFWGKLNKRGVVQTATPRVAHFLGLAQRQAECEVAKKPISKPKIYSFNKAHSACNAPLLKNYGTAVKPINLKSAIEKHIRRPSSSTITDHNGIYFNQKRDIYAANTQILEKRNHERHQLHWR